MASNTQAAPILTFGQSANGPSITTTNYVQAGQNRTQILGVNVPITISQFASAVPTTPAFLNLTLNSTSAASTTTVPTPGGPVVFYTESFSGSATFTSALNGLGTNYLTVNFIDLLFATKDSSSLTISASDTPATPLNVIFTSSVLTPAQLQDPRAISFSFADVSPTVHLFGTGANVTLAAFRSSISGTASAGSVVIPEPASLALLGAGLVFAGLGLTRRKSSSLAA